MPKRDVAYMADRRSDIIQAARRILIERGLGALSTTELCREAGISMGALYTHFASKDEVIRGLAEYTTEDLNEVYDFHDAAEMRERLLELAAAAQDPARSQQFRVDLELLSASRSDARLGDMWTSYRESRHLVLALRRLARVGQLRADLDAEAAATAIESIIVGSHFLSLVGGKSSLDPVGAMTLLLDALAPRTA